jgi:hypothetical protein
MQKPARGDRAGFLLLLVWLYHQSYFFFLASFGFGSGVSACGSNPI